MFNFISNLFKYQSSRLSYNPNGKNLIVLIPNKNPEFNIDTINFYLKERNPVLKNARVLFVVTEETKGMISKVEESIRSTIHDSKNIIEFRSIFVDGTNSTNVSQKLSEYIKEHNFDNHFINITSDNLLVSTMVYDTFCNLLKGKKFMNIFFYYQTADGASKKVIPLYSDIAFRKGVWISSPRSIKEYFKSYNVSVRFSKDLIDIDNSEFLTKLRLILKRENENVRDSLRKILNAMYKNYSAKSSINIKTTFCTKYYNKEALPQDYLNKLMTIEPTTLSKIENYVKQAGFCDDELSYSQLFFLCDGWFEELVYRLNKSLAKVQDDKIVKNLEIFTIAKQKDQKPFKNEFDVVYLNKNNDLNIIECKNSASKSILESAIYKSRALGIDYGISTNLEIWTSAKDIDEQLFVRAKEYGIRIVTGDIIEDMVKRVFNVDDFILPEFSYNSKVFTRS